MLLSQMPWVEVRKEMTEAKGLDPEVADRIGEYVKLKGKWPRSFFASVARLLIPSLMNQVEKSWSLNYKMTHSSLPTKLLSKG